MRYGAKEILDIMHAMAEIDTYTMMLINASDRTSAGMFKQELENTINEMRGRKTHDKMGYRESSCIS